MRNNYQLLIYMLLTATIAACSDNIGSFGDDTAESGMKIELTGNIEQVAATRVNDNGFVGGDVMGV